MENTNEYCLSCNAQLSAEDKYCPQCGLETVYRNLSLKFLLKSFFEAFLNFDVKIFHSFRDIWIPNKITKTFLEGRREYHVHPFRFYFIILVIFFMLLSQLMKNIEFDDLHLKESISKFELYHQFDTLSQNYVDQCETGIIDSLKILLEDDDMDLMQDTFFNANIMGTDMSTYGISTYDGMTLEPDSLFSKYNITNKKDQHLITQMRRVFIHPETAAKFAIGNMIWGFILLTIVMGGVLKLLYIRHESYYIEHLLHISNYHCLTLVLLSIAMALRLMYPENALFASLMGVFWLGGVLYLIVGLVKYYGENVFKTLLKCLILGTAYWLAILMIIIIISLISLYIF